MSIRIKPEKDTAEPACRDYVRVSTYYDPLDDTVTLATVQRFVEKQAQAPSAAGRIHVKTLILSQPMSPEQAMCFATRYAERKNIPVVYSAEVNA